MAPSIPNIGLEQLKSDALEMLKDSLLDVTSPEVQAHVQSIVDGWIKLGVMKAQGASEEFQAEYAEDLKARGEALLNLPGIVAAGKTQQALNMLLSIGTVFVNVAFTAATAGINKLIPLTTA